MKKLLAIPLFIFFTFNICYAQQWDSLGHGVTGGAGGEWGVSTLTPYKGNIFVGGKFGLAGGFDALNIAEWNGVNWVNIDSGSTKPIFAYIAASCIYDSVLYVGGQFDSISNKALASIASWNGVNWNPLGSGLKLIDGFEVYSMCVYNGELYVGGSFDSIGGIPAINIAKWNGSTWSAIGSGVSYKLFTNSVNSLCVYNGELYVGGIFDSAGGIPVSNIAKWNDTTWSQVSNGIKKKGIVGAMALYKGLLYIGGCFDTAGGKPINNIAVWDGTNWLSVGTGIAFDNGIYGVSSLSIFESALCVGGVFDTAGSAPANNIAFWNGTNWGTIGSGIPWCSDINVRALCSFNSILYAAGEFQAAGGIPVNNIAQWTGPLAVPQFNEENGQCEVSPNPSNGTFIFQISNDEHPVMNIEVYNVLGDKVFSSNYSQSTNHYSLDLSSQPDGVYFYRVTSNIGALIGEGKLVIAK